MEATMISKSDALYFHKKYPNGLSSEEFNFIKKNIEGIEVDYNILIKLTHVGVGALRVVIETQTKDYDFKTTYRNYKKLGFPLLAMKESIHEAKAKIDTILHILAYEESEDDINKQSPRYNFHVQFGNRPRLISDSILLEKIFKKYAHADDIIDIKVADELFEEAS